MPASEASTISDTRLSGEIIEEYPLWIGGRVYSREDLLFHACQNLSARRVEASRFLGDGRLLSRIESMCRNVGLDPNMFG
jgi:hypothetical protein